MRFTCAVLIGCVLSATFAISRPLNAQDEDYKNNRQFKDALRQAETGKSWKDRYSDFRLANQISGNRCAECVSKAMHVALRHPDYDLTKEAAEILMKMPGADKHLQAEAAVCAGLASTQEDIENADQNKLLNAEPFFRKAIEVDPAYGRAYYELGRILVPLRNPAEAKEMFKKAAASEDLAITYHARAKRFIDHPDWAMVKMLPDFSVKTLDGKTIDTESLVGKVVLIIFPRYDMGRNFLKSDPFPELEKISKDLKDEPLEMITVFWGPSAHEGVGFAKKHPLPWAMVSDEKSDLTVTLRPPVPFPSYVIADMRGAIVANTKADSKSLENYLNQVIQMNVKVLGDSLSKK